MLLLLLLLLLLQQVLVHMLVVVVVVQLLGGQPSAASGAEQVPQEGCLPALPLCAPLLRPKGGLQVRTLCQGGRGAQASGAHASTPQAGCCGGCIARAQGNCCRL